MRTNFKTELIQWILIAAMFLFAAISWPSAPDRIPVHWGFSGEPDRYGGKFEGLLLLPLLALGLYLLLLYLPRIDPGRANYERFKGAYSVIRVATLAVLASIHGFILLWIRGVQLDFSVVVPVLVGVLLIVIGSVLGKVRPNWFVGIRTPWTLASKLSWTKTHRLGGWLFVVVGLVFISSGFVGSAWAIVAGLVVAAGCVLWLVVYSYLVWRSDPRKIPAIETSPAGEE